MEHRLQKALSMAGVCSRRTAEEYITAGRVKVNGVTATLGEKVDPEIAEITLDGVVIGAKPDVIYVMLNKPKGYVTTLDDERGRKTVADLVATCGTRVWPVGRLDIDSEGLLLLTNDGDLTYKLMHPSHEIEKEYWVRVSGDISAALPILTGPMELDGVPIRLAKVRALGIDRLSIIIHEGKNRQVRRMCQQAGLEVQALRRVREGSLGLGDLALRQWRHLKTEEVDMLKAL